MFMDLFVTARVCPAGVLWAVYSVTRPRPGIEDAVRPRPCRSRCANTSLIRRRSGTLDQGRTHTPYIRQSRRAVDSSQCSGRYKNLYPRGVLDLGSVQIRLMVTLALWTKTYILW